jgi:hypothetical protein
MPVGPHVPHRANEQDNVESTAERVAAVQELRVRGVQQVGDLRCRSQRGGNGKPAEELVATLPETPQEPDGGHSVKHRHRELQDELRQLQRHFRAGGRVGHQGSHHLRRQRTSERGGEDQGQQQRCSHATQAHHDQWPWRPRLTVRRPRGEDEQQGTERTGDGRSPDGQVIRCPARYGRHRHQEQVG